MNTVAPGIQGKSTLPSPRDVAGKASTAGPWEETVEAAWKNAGETLPGGWKICLCLSRDILAFLLARGTPRLSRWTLD